MLVCAKYGTNPTLVETQDQHFFGGEQQNWEKCGMWVKGRNKCFFLEGVLRWLDDIVKS
jgi:hypothetical protein